MSQTQTRDENVTVDAAAIETEQVPSARVVPVIATLVISAFIMILNETLLSVALPALMSDFSVTAVTAQWLTTGFMLTLAIVIPTTGFLIQKYTTRQLFTFALISFAIGTVIAAIAPAFWALMLARVIQAVGTAIILPLLMTTTLTSVAPQHRGMVMGLNSIVISVAPALGPTVSGAVVNAVGWRWLFWGMLPIALIVLICGMVAIKTNNDRMNPRLDALSVLLAAIGFGGIVYGFSTLSSAFEGNFFPVVALVLAVVFLAVFSTRQKRLAADNSALLDLSVLSHHNYRMSMLIVIICMASMLGSVIVLPLYMQNVLGLSALTTGLLMLPGGLIQGVLSPIVGRLYDRIGPRPLVIPGALFLAVGQWGAITLNADSSPIMVVVWNLIFCIGMATLMTTLMTEAMGVLPRQLYGHGSALMNTVQQLAGAAGTALFIAAMTVGAQAGWFGGVGISSAFVVGAVLTLIAVLLAPTIKDQARHAHKVAA